MFAGVVFSRGEVGKRNRFAHVLLGTWRKVAPRTPSNWLDDQGAPLVIPPGPVWVELVPTGSPLKWA